MKPEEKLMLDALDRELAGYPAAGVDREELDRLHDLVAGIRNMPGAEPPPNFSDLVMAALPEKFSLWSRLKGFFVRPHVIRLNVAWEAGLAVAVLAVALTFQGRQMPVVQHHAKAAAQVIHTRFTVKAPHAKRVSLAGDFNNWRHNELRLLKAEAKGVWTVTVPLSPGRYKYMFVVDGKQWQTDPLAESHEQDGFGNKNAVVEVGPPERLSV